jgi:hypothetical protein
MACSAPVVVQAQLVETVGGLVPDGEGWFVLNARKAQWWNRRVTVCDFEGEPRFRQLGINLTLLEPGEPMTMYHWEADQEDFLVLSGEKGKGWGAYTVDEAALRRGAGVERETTEGSEAYAGFPPWKLIPFRDDWLPY